MMEVDGLQEEIVALRYTIVRVQIQNGLIKPEPLTVVYINISRWRKNDSWIGGQGSNHGTVYFWNTSFGSNIIWSNEFSRMLSALWQRLSASGKHAHYGGQPEKYTIS